MARIDEIVSILNNSFANALEIGNGAIFGICDKIISDSKTIFYEKLANNVQKGVFVDDSFPLTIIHYIENDGQETQFNQGFGSSALRIESFDVTCLLFLSNVDNSLDQKNIVQLIIDTFPNSLSSQITNSMGARKVTMNGTSASFKKHDIWKEQFIGQSDNLSDNSIFMKLSYSVKIETISKCVGNEYECTDDNGFNIYGGDAQTL